MVARHESLGAGRRSAGAGGRSPGVGGRPLRVDGRGLPRAAHPLLRRLAVERVARGESPRRVMEGLGLCRTSIYRWLRAARARGAEALEPRPHPGPTPIAGPREAAALRRLLVGRVPADHGFPGRLWTRATVRALLEREMSLRMSLPAVGRLLRRAGLHPGVGAIPPPEFPRRETRGLLLAVDGRGAFLCVPFAGRGTALSFADAAALLSVRADRRVDLFGVRDPGAPV